MTEEEAKTKWCPYARSALEENYGTQNRDINGGIDSACMCIGSDCMAWRDQSTSLNGQIINRGYCGLAGKP